VTGAGAPDGGYIGRRLPRLEDRRLVTGQGIYAGDLAPERLAHLAVMRSPLPHARVRFLGLDAARALPGVLAAWRAADLAGCPTALPDAVAGVVGRPRPLLAGSEVLHVGEPIAVVVAESGAVPTPGAVANAVEDALHRLGHRVSVDDLPITPDRLFALTRGRDGRQPGR